VATCYGPAGGLVRCFVSDGIQVFCGLGGGGIFRTSDNGAAWSSINNGLTTKDVKTLVFNGTDLFAGTETGVWKNSQTAASGSMTTITGSYTMTKLCRLTKTPAGVLFYRIVHDAGVKNGKFLRIR
jgi:hypothetical protein